MIKRVFGNTGVEVPLIGQGSWQFPSGKSAIEETQQALLTGVDLGMVHIDTAEMYGNSELVIGDAIKDLPRQSLFLVSKVLPNNASYEGTIAACEKSLKRLKTDYLDCYLLHWRGAHPLAQTIAALEKLQDDGKILSLGVSNFDEKDLQEAVALLKKHKIACNQVLYNLHQRGIERNVLPFCRKNNIALVGYTPFAQKDVPSASSKNGAVLHEIAARHGATVRQVILAFLVRQDSLFTIPKASKVEHTRENAAAGDLKLSDEDTSIIEKAFPAPNKDIPLAMI